MKKILTPSLALILLVLGVAGIAWAGQATVQAPQEVAEAPAPEEAPAVSPSEPAGAPAEISLDDLFQEPIEVDYCCTIDCREERISCSGACAPGDSACQAACWAQYDNCLTYC